jgi:hypothetical protein
MPIVRYFVIVGSVLMALLYYADAKLPKSGPIAIGSQVVELPGAKRTQIAMGSSLVVAQPAPAPDMKSAAVLAAAPPSSVSTQVADAPQVQAPAQKTAEAERTPVKKKHVARRQDPRLNDTQHYASRGFDDGGNFFGNGGGTFGRF